MCLRCLPGVLFDIYLDILDWKGAKPQTLYHIVPCNAHLPRDGKQLLLFPLLDNNDNVLRH